jgi:hypothetical protein
MKLHLGCGSVYLEDYVNIDLQGPKTFLAVDRPDLVKGYRTTEDQYYARHRDKTQDRLRAGPLDQEYVCDHYGDFFSLFYFGYSQVEEILARQTFEHLSFREAHRALDQACGVLKPGGLLRIDVPDHEATLDLLCKTGDTFYKRHLLGPRRSEDGYHLVGYTRDILRTLVESHGFKFITEEENIHWYPAFTLRFKKLSPWT